MTDRGLGPPPEVCARGELAVRSWLRLARAITQLELGNLAAARQAARDAAAALDGELVKAPHGRRTHARARRKC
jgi:hypothetical protein